MASVAGDAKGILLIDRPTSQTSTGKYYANLLDQLQEKIHEKKKARFGKEKFHLSSGQCLLAWKRRKTVHKKSLDVLASQKPLSISRKYSHSRNGWYKHSFKSHKVLIRREP